MNNIYNDLVSLTEEKEDIVSTALLYLENKGCIEIKDDNIIYIDNPIPKGRADKAYLDNLEMIPIEEQCNNYKLAYAKKEKESKPKVTIIATAT